MKEEIAKLWIADLRSGKHEQGTGLLKRGDKYCCLGRLCDISGLGSFENDIDVPLDNFISTNGELNSCVLPESVMEWAGIKSDNGLLYPIPNYPHCRDLTGLNDSGKTFVEIADIIEKNWEAL